MNSYLLSAAPPYAYILKEIGLIQFVNLHRYTAAVKSLLTVTTLLQQKLDCALLCAIQVAVRPASTGRRACALAALTVPRKALVPLAARLWLKQVSEARKLVSANG